MQTTESKVPLWKHMVQAMPLCGYGDPDTTHLSVVEAITGQRWGKECVAALHKACIDGAPLAGSAVHGMDHWRSVLRNGHVLLAGAAWDAERFRATGNHPRATRLHEGQLWAFYTDTLYLFAIAHDCRRYGEEQDYGHGAYGAAVLQQVMGNYGYGADNCMELRAAMLACNLHTGVTCPGNDPAMRSLHERDHIKRAIGLCLDADRLDLTRLGIPVRQACMMHGGMEQLQLDMIAAGCWDGDVYGK
jgi:hypothetical protein